MKLIKLGNKLKLIKPDSCYYMGGVNVLPPPLTLDEEKELLTFFKESLGIKRSPLKNLLLYKEDAIISKKLATIKTDIEEIQNMDLDSLALNIDNEKMHEIFMNLGMVSLVK